MKTLSLIALLFFTCCESKESFKNSGTEKNIVADSNAISSCPLLSKDTHGNLILSYVREVNDSVAFFSYVVSKDNGSTFSSPVEIKQTSNIHPHGENLPKIIFKPGGDILAMWGVSNPNPNSKYSGLLYYAQSFDDGKTWTDATLLVKDTSAYDQRYFDIALLPAGEVMVIWLDNRGMKEHEGSTLFSAVTNGRSGFGNEKRIGETCCPCCRTDLMIDKKGNIHASFRDIINDSIRDMVHLFSLDGGNTFSSPARISEDNWVINACPHTGPSLAINNEGLHFVWYTMGNGEGVFYSTSPDLGKSFCVKDTVSGNASAKHPQIIALTDGNLVIVWDENVKHGEKTNCRIGLQMRSPEGKIILTKYLTSPEVICEFPSVYSPDGKKVIVAYTKKSNDKKQVMYNSFKF